MSPAHHTSSFLSRWAAACAVLIALGWPASVRAYTFNLVSNGSGQHLTWFWEGGNGCSVNCLSSGCGNVLSANGEIPYSANGTGGNLCGGLLDWTATSGSLSVVAVPTVSATTSGANSCAGRWAAVDAREIPLVFAVTPEVGDPFPLDVTVEVRPRLLGSIEQLTSVNLTTGEGTEATLWLQMIATVDVDGQLVSGDSLMTDLALTDGADSFWQLSVPNGDANSVVVAGLTAGSEITIRIWAYMRAYCFNPVPGSASIYATSAHAQGPAIEILIQNLNAVDVPPQPDPATLSLAAWPNPAPGSARIEYTLPRPSQVRLSIYDLAGARVATLADGFEMAGRNARPWDGRSSHGERLAPGVYVVELVAGAQRSTRRLVLLGR